MMGVVPCNVSQEATGDAAQIAGDGAGGRLGICQPG
jgi:hypothetical protein